MGSVYVARQGLLLLLSLIGPGRAFTAWRAFSFHCTSQAKCVQQLLSQHHEELERLAHALLEQEVLDEQQLQQPGQRRAHARRTRE